MPPSELPPILAADDPRALDRALEILHAGGLVAFPTDTVYGLGALAFEAEAVARLYLAKGRLVEKAIPILVGEAEGLDQVGEPSEMARRLARAFWPGPLTLVVAKRPEVPQVVSLTGTVGVRLPNHPAALRLLRRAGPLAVTSANRSGSDNPRSAGDVMAELGDRVQLILDGGTSPGGQPSTVVDCTGDTPLMLREGPLTLRQIQRALGGEEGLLGGP
jgi:L-threonylcarbamoyladenylate synthase